MNDFEKQMHAKYHKLLDGLAQPRNRSCLSFGFECGEGWYPIIEDALEKLHKLDEEIYVEQIKEKFGTMRFYISNGSDEAFKITEEAEKKSETTCEICGEKGELRSGGWLKTLCDKHWAENLQNKLEYIMKDNELLREEIRSLKELVKEGKWLDAWQKLGGEKADYDKFLSEEE
jgi:hypothetical protein